MCGFWTKGVGWAGRERRRSGWTESKSDGENTPARMADQGMLSSIPLLHHRKLYT